jgi:hypothetical protein
MSLLNITIEPEIREINNNYLVSIFLPKNFVNFTFEIFGDKGYFNSGNIEFTSGNSILSFFIDKIQILFLNITENNVRLRYQYFLEMKKMKRRSISKDDLPEELWKNYSRENEFNCFYIMKAEDKNKKRRSPPRRSPTSMRSPSKRKLDSLITAKLSTFERNHNNCLPLENMSAHRKDTFIKLNTTISTSDDKVDDNCFVNINFLKNCYNNNN